MNGSNSRKQRNQRRGCSRNKYRGGGLGTSYGFGGSVDPNNPSIGNAAEVVTFPSCGNAIPTGFLADPGTKGGLPGFAGGARRTMHGGVYTTVPNVVGDSKIALLENSYTGCGEGRFSLANPSVQQPPEPGYPATYLTAPGPLVPSPAPGAPFTLQKGGAAVPPSYAVDAMLYQAPRTGYSEGPSSGPTSAGPPFSIHTPYDLRPTPSAACLKTGGARRKNKKGSKKTRKNRKNRNTRKNRKSSRKNRKSRKSRR